MDIKMRVVNKDRGEKEIKKGGIYIERRSGTVYGKRIEREIYTEWDMRERKRKQKIVKKKGALEGEEKGIGNGEGRITLTSFHSYFLIRNGTNICLPFSHPSTSTITTLTKKYCSYTSVYCTYFW